MFLFVMIFGFIAFTTITLGMTSYVMFESKAAKQVYRHDLALSIAEAGIDYYRWHLTNYPDDYYDGHGPQSLGPYFHDYLDKDGNVIGTYSLTIIPPPEGTHVVIVRSTGWSSDNPSSPRTIKVYFGYESFSDSSFVVNANMTFSATSVVHGKVFANGTIEFNGINDSWVDSATVNGVSGSGGPQEFWRSGLPTRSFAGVGSDFSLLADMANEPEGLLLENSTWGWHLKFKSDGTFDLSKVNSSPNQGDITSETFQENKLIPANGVIYSNGGDVWVEGVVNGRVTVVAGNSADIYVPNNLTYSAKYSDDIIGLLADDNIYIPYTVPNDLEIDGALLARNGTIKRQYYTGTYGLRNSLTIFGSQIELLRGGFKYGTAPNYSSGFVNTIYTYDGNLLYQPPIGIPVTPGYKLISWQEVMPGECDGHNPCPVLICGGKTNIFYGGQSYDLLVAGDQCWFADNLNVGNMIMSNVNPSNSSLIEKWCYNNVSANCNTDGGLYTWAEAMQLDPSCNSTSCVDFIGTNHQGICPTGYHIPTDDDFKTFESYLGMTQNQVDVAGYRGTDQGTQLKIGGNSGFDFRLAGNHATNNSFGSQGTYGFLWSASEFSTSNTWNRLFYSNEVRVGRYLNIKEEGLSVRCLRSPTPCNGQTSISYSGQNYDLVEIGDQCWLENNLNVGTMIANNGEPNNNSLVEKWCYNNSNSNCTIQGGLYSWSEAMQFDPSCNSTSCAGSIGINHQGICPTGYHIPTDAEIKKMEIYLGMTQGQADMAGYRGTDQGTQLKIGGSSGFNALLTGNTWGGSNSFARQGSYGGIWSSSEISNTNNAWGRIFSTASDVDHSSESKVFGYAVRCLKSTDAVSLPSAPSAPVISSLVVSSSSIQVNWGSISGASYYTVSSTIVGQGITTVTQTNTTFNNLLPNTDYSFQVQATDSFDQNSTYSSVTSSYTNPAIPINLSATSASTTIINLAWEANSNPGNTVYQIYNNTNSVIVATTTNVNYSVTNLNPATLYSFKVRAQNISDNNYTNYTNNASSTTYAPPPPSAPTLNAFSNITATTIQANWNAISGVLYYTVSSTAGTVTTTNTYYNFTNLTPVTNYIFQVKTTDNYSQSSSYSSTGNATTDIPAPPSTPSIISATPGPSNIIINWGAVVGASYYSVAIALLPPPQTITVGNGTSSSYKLPINRYYNNSAAEMIYLNSELSGMTGSISSLAFYKASGSNATTITGVSIYLKHTTASTLSTGTTNLTGYTLVYSGSFPNSSSSGWLSVNLDTPFIYNGTDNLQILVVKSTQSSTSSYPVYRYTSATNRSRYYQNDSTPWSSSVSLTSTNNRPNILFSYSDNTIFGSAFFTATTTNTSYNFTSGLVPSNMYLFQMSASDNYSQTSASSTIYSTSTLPTPPPPDAPIISSVTAIGSSSVQVSWGAVAGTSYYAINSGVIAVTTTQTNFVFDTLSPNTSYDFQVRSVDIYDQPSDYSDPASGYTDPVIPTNLSAVVNSSTQIDLSWEANSNSVATIYEIYNNTNSSVTATTTGTNYTVSSLIPATLYSFKVRAQYLSNPANYTSYTSDASATTAGPCNGQDTLNYSGQDYGLVDIGTQCWFADNLNVGTKLASVNTIPSNNSLIEKWCYSNNDAYCATDGGLYTWSEALQLDPSCNTATCNPSTPVQGICPAGWHIPSDTEIKTMESYLGMCAGAGTGCVGATGYRGTDQGTKLKVGGSSGFDVILTGYRITSAFTGRNSYNYLWSSSEYSTSAAWKRMFYSGYATVERNNFSKINGFSIRCLQN